MVVADRISVRIRKDKSHLSDSENGQTNAECTLAKFDIRNSDSNVNENEKDQILSTTHVKGR
ncbi:MAG: hypothetical protein M3044_02100 [Thermoproteota archaeon]|nr:hypothetical protein [Thermoproteota archaeon]